MASESNRPILHSNRSVRASPSFPVIFLDPHDGSDLDSTDASSTLVTKRLATTIRHDDRREKLVRNNENLSVCSDFFLLFFSSSNELLDFAG